MKFGDRLRQILEERGIKQKEIAIDLHIAPNTMGNYVRNEREPDYATLKRIAQHLHVSTDFLLGTHLDEAKDERENELLLLYRALDTDQKSLLIEQAKLLQRQQKR